MKALVNADVTGKPNAHVTVYVPEKYFVDGGVSLELLETAGFDAVYTITNDEAPGSTVTIKSTTGKARCVIAPQ